MGKVRIFNPDLNLRYSYPLYKNHIFIHMYIIMKNSPSSHLFTIDSRYLSPPDENSQLTLTFLSSAKLYVVGAQKNCLTDRVLSSTQYSLGQINN